MFYFVLFVSSLLFLLLHCASLSSFTNARQDPPKWIGHCNPGLRIGAQRWVGISTEYSWMAHKDVEWGKLATQDFEYPAFEDIELHWAASEAMWKALGSI